MFVNNMQEYLPALLTGDIDYANCTPPTHSRVSLVCQ